MVHVYDTFQCILKFFIVLGSSKPENDGVECRLSLLRLARVRGIRFVEEVAEEEEHVVDRLAHGRWDFLGLTLRNEQMQ